MSFAISSVKAESKFIDVAAKMFRARMMVNPMQAPLEDRPYAVNAVRGHAVFDIIPGAVINRSVLVKQTVQARINRRIIGMNHGADFNMVEDCAVQGRLVRAVKRLGNRIAAPLPKPNNADLTNRTPALFQFLALMLGGFFAPDVGFIDFDDSPEFSKVPTTGFPKPMQHEPSRHGCSNFPGSGNGQGRHSFKTIPAWLLPILTVEKFAAVWIQAYPSSTRCLPDCWRAWLADQLFFPISRGASIPVPAGPPQRKSYPFS